MSSTTTVTQSKVSEALTSDNAHITLAERPPANIIQAEVAYLKYQPNYELEKLYTMNYDTGDKFPRTNAKNERGLQAPPSVETCGFTTKKLQSVMSMADFDDTDKVEDVFYTEIKDLLRQVYPNARYIGILEHQIRKRTPQFPYHTGEPYQNLLPTTLVHVDFMPESAALISRALFRDAADQYPNLLVVNLWKSLQGPGDDWPLALCDVRTVDYDSDVVNQDIVFENRFYENMRVYYSDKHAWYYYSDVKDDEIVLFQQMDSKDSTGRGVPHSGFLNSYTDANAAPRVSVEIRVFVYLE